MKWNETMEKLAQTTNVTRRELVLGAAACTFGGMVVGMLVAKMATGWNWSLNLGSGNGSGNQNNGNGNQAEPASGDTSVGKACKKQKCRKKKVMEKELEEA